MFINVPVGARCCSSPRACCRRLPRSDDHFDFAGAATSTLGMTALVYGFVRAAAEPAGATAPRIGSFAAAVVLLAGFVASEQRAEQPITPLRLFASRERSAPTWRAS